jgi:hypothetical protein
MSLLFTVESKVVSPTTQVLLIPPFKEIWERDTSTDKRYAIEDFSYIEFMASIQKSNPYSGYAEHQRPEKIIKDVITREDWDQEDPLLVQGIAKLKEFQAEASVTYNYYMAAKSAAEKMQQFFINFSMSDVNLRTGAPIFKPKDITSALNDTSRVLENLNTLREKVDNEVFEEIKKKGQKVVSPFADPSSLK